MAAVHFELALIQDEYRAEFGEELELDVFRFVKSSYGEAIKEVLGSSCVVRLPYLGALHPGKRIKFADMGKKVGEELGGLEKGEYICGSDVEINSAYFKPTHYVNRPTTATAETTDSPSDGQGVVFRPIAL